MIILKSQYNSNSFSPELCALLIFIPPSNEFWFFRFLSRVEFLKCFNLHPVEHFFRKNSQQFPGDVEWLEYSPVFVCTWKCFEVKTWKNNVNKHKNKQISAEATDGPIMLKFIGDHQGFNPVNSWKWHRNRIEIVQVMACGKEMLTDSHETKFFQEILTRKMRRKFWFWKGGKKCSSSKMNTRRQLLLHLHFSSRQFSKFWLQRDHLERGTAIRICWGIQDIASHLVPELLRPRQLSFLERLYRWRNRRTARKKFDGWKFTIEKYKHLEHALVSTQSDFQ